MKKKGKVILSIDGGGIRGVIPLLILKQLQNYFKRVDSNFNFANFIDVFSGTSTGAIISAALMLKDKNGIPQHSVDTVLNLYATRGKQIFSNSTALQEKSFPLKIVLENNFGNYTLKSVKQHFLFLSYDLKSNQPFLFTDTCAAYDDVNLAKAMLACSSIPNYFPSVGINAMELVDGAFFTKNTSKMALDYAKSLFPNEHLVLLSLGTGNLHTENKDQLEKDMEQVHDELTLLNKKDTHFTYFRFQPDIITANDAMDDASPENIKALIADTKHYIQSNSILFNEFLSLFS